MSEQLEDEHESFHTFGEGVLQHSLERIMLFVGLNVIKREVAVERLEATLEWLKEER